MKIAEIKNKEIRSSALKQLQEQMQTNIPKFILVTFPLSQLDFKNTIEGFDFWNRISNRKELKKLEMIEKRKNRRVTDTDRVLQQFENNKSFTAYELRHILKLDTVGGLLSKLRVRGILVAEKIKTKNGPAFSYRLSE